MLFYYHYNPIHFYRLKKALPRHGNIPAMSMPVTELLSYKNRPLRAGLDLTFRVSARKGRFVLSEFCHPQAGSNRFLFQEMA